MGDHLTTDTVSNTKARVSDKTKFKEVISDKSPNSSSDELSDHLDE